MRNIFDLIIAGGGIMGLFTAYFASKQGQKVLLLESSTIGNLACGSSGFTRSFRYDYTDREYVELVIRAKSLWSEFETECHVKALIECGCLNLASTKITPDLNSSYALQSMKVMTSSKLPVELFDTIKLNNRFPQFKAECATLDPQGGFMDVASIQEALLYKLKERGVAIIENTSITSISESKNSVIVQTSKSSYFADAIVLTVGRWTNQILEIVQENKTCFPIVSERPLQCKYFIPKDRSKYLWNTMPVFACLDQGIYGHPIWNEMTPGVKIGLYRAPSMQKSSNSQITTVEDWVEEFIPDLRDAVIEPVTTADQGAYQMVPDNDFILGALDNFSKIFVGAGWCGTGYKFAPLIGDTLCKLSRGLSSNCCNERFSPSRFRMN